MRAAHKELLIFLLVGTGLAVGNDGAASTAAGGIQLVREPRIAMRAEKLTIARENITVDYDFSNDTDQDITTEVAFPIPPYTFDFNDPGAPQPEGFRGFNDFAVWVNSAPIKCAKLVTAWLNGNDVTAKLKSIGIDADTFGNFDFMHQPNPQSPQIAGLSQAGQQELVRSGLVSDDTNRFPEWTVKKTYYWRQTFPAHATTHIRHQYQPVIGFTPIQLAPQLPPHRTPAATSDLPNAWGMRKEDAQVLADACVTPQLQEKLVSEAKGGNSYVEAFWVDYILTTANTWKTPISDFRLIVERPKGEGPSGSGRPFYVSFCWDGPVRRLDKDRFEADMRDFVPSKELHIAFFAP